MATTPFVTMQQRRGLKANLPTAAPAGQLLVATDTKELFFGTDTGVEAFASDVSLSRTRFVALTGSNTTGNGSINKPYANISAALASITDASPTNRYVIRVAPGLYSEATTVNLKANVYIVGDHYQAVRYNASFAIDSSFSSNSDHRTGMSQMMIQGFTANFSSVTSNQGKVYFEDVTFISAVSITAQSNINQLIMDGCQVFGAITLDGMNSRIVNTQFESTFALNQPTSASCTASTAVVNGSYFLSTLTVTGASKSTNLFLYNSQVSGNATINGAFATITASAESLPNKANIITQNSGTFIRSDDAFSISFTPADASKWSTVPNNVLDAIDTLANASGQTTIITVPTATTSWTITHNLNKRPSVTAVNGDGQFIFGDLKYDNNNQVTLTFSTPISGAVYLN
jgi:hypothetical protein